MFYSYDNSIKGILKEGLIRAIKNVRQNVVVRLVYSVYMVMLSHFIVILSNLSKEGNYN